MNRLPILLALLLAACSGAPTAQPPLAGAAIGGPFALIDGAGRPVTDRSFAGRWRIMYFGYTYCPDVCPMDMANLAGGLQQFAAKDAARAGKVALIFVTVDPERDTPPVVGRFAQAFGPQVTGLTGTPAAIAKVSEEYRVYARKRPGTSPGSYLVDHSRAAYLMDPAGKPIALLPSDESASAVAAKLAQWVA